MEPKTLQARSTAPSTLGQKAKSFFVKNFRPTLFEGTMKEYHAIMEAAPPKPKTNIVVRAARKTRVFVRATGRAARSNFKMWAIRTGSAFAAYGALNYAYGVRSWNLGAPNAERMVNDAGPVAKVAITAVSGLFSPATRVALADTLVAAEWAMCGVRMVFEQAAWRKTNFSGEFAGTGMTPLLAGMIEAGYKSIEQYPTDPNMRFTIALMGMWGNLVRIAHSSLIIVFGNRIWDKITGRKRDPPYSGGSVLGPGGRNGYGFPVTEGDSSKAKEEPRPVPRNPSNL